MPSASKLDWICATCGKRAGFHFIGNDPHHGIEPNGYWLCPDPPFDNYGHGVYNPLTTKRFKKKEPDMELKVTKERVLAAAAKCSDASRILKELFPEAFSPEEKRLLFKQVGKRLEGLYPDGSGCVTDISPVIGKTPEDAGRGLYLSADIDWTLEPGSHTGSKLLVGRVKK